MAEYIDYTQATTLFGDVDARFDTVEGKIPSNASSGNKMVTASDIATKADLVDGKVPAAQLPSFVDDVLEYASTSAFPATGESGKIYVALDTNKTYRWGGSDYAEISESLALGETSSTAYAGDKGKANADAISDIQDLIPSGASTSNKLATASDIPTVPTTDQTYDATSTNPQSGTAVASAISSKADTSDIPTALADLTDDSTHRVVTDTEKTTWSGKQDALTFDNAPTANSNNPVKSGGIKTAIDNSFSASEGEIRDTVGWTGKNVMPVHIDILKANNTSGSGTWSGNTFTHNKGVVFACAVNECGYVTDIELNGTATGGDSDLYLFIGMPSWMKSETNYILSGCPSGGSADSYRMQYSNWTEGASYSKTDTGEGVTIQKITDSTTQRARIWVKSGYTISGKHFKPMIRPASISDPTFEPHHESVDVCKLSISDLKTVVAASSDFADFKTRIAAL